MEDWEDEEEYTLPTKLTRKEKKILAKAAKKEISRKEAQQKEMKNAALEVKRLAGSQVDLHMMRTTTEGNSLKLKLHQLEELEL